jgi:hypothetical protein
VVAPLRQTCVTEVPRGGRLRSSLLFPPTRRGVSFRIAYQSSKSGAGVENASPNDHNEHECLSDQNQSPSNDRLSWPASPKSPQQASQQESSLFRSISAGQPRPGPMFSSLANVCRERSSEDHTGQKICFPHAKSRYCGPVYPSAGPLVARLPPPRSPELETTPVGIPSKLTDPERRWQRFAADFDPETVLFTRWAPTCRQNTAVKAHHERERRGQHGVPRPLLELR